MKTNATRWQVFVMVIRLLSLFVFFIWFIIEAGKFVLNLIN